LPAEQQEEARAGIEKLMERIPEASVQAMQHWEHVRNIFPVLGNASAPFMAITFRFGEQADPGTGDMPNPSTFRVWDLAGTGKIISRLQQGAVTFYLCELNLSVLASLVTQVTAVLALSVIKWAGRALYLLADLM